MAEEINGIKIVATITPELDQNKTKQVIKEIKGDFEAGLKDLDFSDSAVKAAKAVNDAIDEVVKARKLYASKGGKSKMQAFKVAEESLRGVSPLSLRDNKAVALELLKKARQELYQIKPSKGLPKASLEAAQARADAALAAAQKMRPSKKMLERRAPAGSAITKSIEKELPEQIQKDRQAIARKIEGLIPELERLPWEKSDGRWNTQRHVTQAVNEIFDRNAPVDSTMNYIAESLRAAFRDKYPELSAEEQIKRQLGGVGVKDTKQLTSMLKSLSEIRMAAKTLDTSNLERSVKPEREGLSEVEEDINKVIDKLEEKQFQLEMIDRMNWDEHDAWAKVSNRIKALKELRDQGVKSVRVEGKSETNVAQAITELEEHLNAISGQFAEKEETQKKAIEALQARLKYLKKLEAQGIESVKEAEPDPETKTVKTGKVNKKHVAADKIRKDANERAKATLQEEKDRKDEHKAMMSAAAARKAAEIKKIEDYIKQNTNPDGTYKWGVYLGKSMSLMPKRRSGAVVKTTLDDLHAKGEALQFNKHRIFRKYDPSYRAGAWYTKNRTETPESAETEKVIDKANESLGSLSAEGKQIYACIGNLTDTVNTLVRYLIEKEAERALKRKGGTASTKTEEQRTRRGGYVYTLAGKAGRDWSGLTMSESLKYRGKKFGYDSPGQLTFKEAMNELMVDAKRQPGSLGEMIKQFFQKASLKTKLFKSAGSAFIKDNPVVQGFKGLSSDVRISRDRRARKMEERISKRTARMEREFRLNTLRLEAKELRKNTWEKRRDRLTGSPLGKIFGAGGKIAGWGGDRMFGPFGRGIKKALAFAKTIKRAFRYRVVRNLVNRIIKLIREGFTNLDKYSEHMGTDFHKNALKLASSLLFLKNAFAAMAGPIVNALTPALETLMDKFAMLANYIGAFFAALTGQSQFTAALKKTVTQTQQAAGKLLDILGFDEINRLSGDNGGDQNVDEMFEEWGEGTIFQAMKEAIENGEWDALGELLAEKVNSFVDKIKENKVGKLIGEKLGGAIKVARSFLEKVDFTDIGATLAEQFNDMISGIDWNDVGGLIARSFTLALDFFRGLISTLGWSQIGTALHDMFVGLFKGFSGWLKDIDWRQMGLDLVQNLVDFITGLDILDILSALVELGASLLKGIAKMIGGVIQGLLESIFGDLPNWLVRLLGGDTTKLDLKANVEESVKAEFEGKSYSILERISKFLEKVFPSDGSGSAAYEGPEPGITGEGYYTILNEVEDEALWGPFRWLYTATKWNTALTEQEIGILRDNAAQSSEAKGYLNRVKDYLYNMIGWGRWLRINDTMSFIGGAIAGGISGGTASVRFGASGGTFDKGQLFIANEAGPELIGNLNGKTTVTNYDQFTQSVIDANSIVVEAVMQVVAAVNNKDFDVYMDSQKVGQSVTQYQNNMARRFGV